VLLVIDVGNTPTVIGIYGDELRRCSDRTRLVPRSRNPRAAAVVIVGVVVLGVLAGLWRLRVLDDIATGSFDLDEAEASDAFVAVSSVLFLVGVVATGIVFIVWMHRSYQNLRAFPGATMRYSTRWAVGGWFVPFLNFARPYQIMDDIWRSSSPHESRTLLGWWWGIWLGAGLLGYLARSTIGDGSELSALRSGTQLGLVSDALSIAAAVLAVIVVGGIIAGQERLAATL
jgi:Domain of unknown function (DUF4328)